jgi:hypothetical protein
LSPFGLSYFILFVLYFFLELVALGLQLHFAGAVPVFFFPLTTPSSPNAVLALDLSLELPSFGLGFY